MNPSGHAAYSLEAHQDCGRGRPRSESVSAPQRGSLTPARGNAPGSRAPWTSALKGRATSGNGVENHGLVSPFRAWMDRGRANPGRCPGLAWAAPLALPGHARRRHFESITRYGDWICMTERHDACGRGRPRSQDKRPSGFVLTQLLKLDQLPDQHVDVRGRVVVGAGIGT